MTTIWHLNQFFNWNFRFSIAVGSQNAKGIHLRRGFLNKPEEFNVTIQPIFMMDKKYGMLLINCYTLIYFWPKIMLFAICNYVQRLWVLNHWLKNCFQFLASKAKIEFNKRLTLIPSQSWIQCGLFLDLCYSPRSIVVVVDPTNLQPGVHTGK